MSGITAATGENIPSPLSAFGEISTIEPTAVLQIQFQYNLNPRQVTTRLNGGAATVENGMMKLSTGASANQSSQLLSRVPVKYNSGQGALVRFTGVFTAGVANSEQYIGIGTIGDGFFFGYDGEDFGILHRKGGVPKVETFTVTTKSSHAENITITLDGDAKADVTVSIGADATVTANEIAAVDYSGVGEGWEVHAMGVNVVFESFSDGAKTGTFSLSSATSAVASVAETLAGVSATNTNIKQSTWSNQTKFTLDPTKGNVYQIKYQWLGFGPIEFFIEDPSDKTPRLVHTIKYANENTTPSINNPTLPLCATVKNTSNASDLVLNSGSMAGFVEGRDSNLGVTHSESIEFTGIGTTETPLLTIHNHTVFQSVLNRVNIEILSVSVAVEGTKPSTFRLTKDAILVAASFSDHEASGSVVKQSTSATSMSGGNVGFSAGLAKVDSSYESLKTLELNMEVKSQYTLSLEASSGTVDGIATISWKEHL